VVTRDLNECQRNRRVCVELDIAVKIPVVASYDDGTCPRLFTLLDEIGFGETLLFVCRLELLSEIVIADATGVDYGVWRQHVLGERRTRLKGREWGRRMWKEHTAAPRAAFCAAPPAT
jgi:hypothetical protein